MVISRTHRRLGDFAAGTLVVREPKGLARGDLGGVHIPAVAEERVMALPNADRLTMAHYALLRDHFARRSRLTPKQAEALAAGLAADVAGVLEVEPAALGDPDSFLAAVAHAFEARHRYYDAPV